MEKALLHLDLSIETGHEVRAARDLHARLPEPQWRLLAALAAEIVHEHELRTGDSVVIVAGPSQAEAVLNDLRRAR